MTPKAAKELDRWCVWNWLNDVWRNPTVAFNTYSDAQQIEFAHDALVLLKEQEPRVMTRLEIEQSEECIVWLEDDQFNSYALVDGIDQRNGWVWLRTVGYMSLQQRRDFENYGKKWRCWTKRPTEDQRKAVKWE